MFIFSHFLGLNERTRRVFFKITALILSVMFVLPELSWAFDWRNLKRAEKNAYLDFEIKKNLAKIISWVAPQEKAPQLSVVHIEDLHTNFEAQEHIQQLITQFVAQNQIRLVAVEGSVGFLDAQRLRRLPYPDLKKQLFRHFMQNGQLSGTEAAALVSDESVVLYGVEDAEAYERSLAIVRKFLGSKVQTQFQLIRYLLEELVGAVNTEELAEMDEKFEAMQDQKVSLSEYLGFLKKRVQSVNLSLAEYPELAELERKGDWEAHDVEVKTRRARQAVRAKLYVRPAQQAAIDRWREDLDRMERVLNIAAFPEDVNYAREQGLRFSLKAFLEFYKDLAPTVGVSAEVEPKLYALDARLQEAMEFYTLAEQRNRMLVANTLKAMRAYKVPRAVLVAGGYHTQGIDAELDARKVSRVTVRPSVRSWQDNAHYYRQLSGEVGPFRSLFMSPEKHLLALSSVLEQRPEQQDFWQAFGALYLSQALPRVQREGLSPEAFRTRIDTLVGDLNQGSPYAVRMDWAAWPGAENTGAIPLMLEAEGRSTRVLAVPGEWRGAAVQPFYTVRQGTDRLALYPVAFTPGMAASLREGATPNWQRSLARWGVGVRAWFLGQTVREWSAARSREGGVASVALLAGVGLGVGIVGLAVGTVGWFPALALGFVAAVGLPWAVRQWTARQALLDAAALPFPRGTAGEPWDEQWESRVEARWKQGTITPTDVARITLQVAGHPQALARWQAWLTRLASAGQHSNVAVQKVAQALLDQYTVRELASVSGQVGTPTLHVGLGETAQQQAEAVLHMYTQAVLSAAQSPLDAGQTPESRLAAAQTALGLAVDAWVHEGWWTPATRVGLERAWQQAVRRLDEALHQAFQQDRRAGWGEAVRTLRFQTLHEVGAFRQGVAGWVDARRQELVPAREERVARAGVRERRWALGERAQWVDASLRMVRTPTISPKAWSAQWGVLRTADVETRLQLFQELLRQDRWFGLRNVAQFNLNLVDMQQRAEELDHDFMNFYFFATGFSQLVAVELSRQSAKHPDLGATGKALDKNINRLVDAIHTLTALSKFVKKIDEEITQALALSGEEAARARALTEATLRVTLSAESMDQTTHTALLRSWLESPEQWRAFGQALLFSRMLEVRELAAAAIPMLGVAVEQAGRADVQLNEEIARRSYLFMHLLRDVFDYPTLVLNADARQTVDLKFIYALMQQEPVLFSRGGLAGNLDLEITAEPDFFTRNERVRGDYGQAILSVVANLVVNAQKELNEKHAAMGAAGEAFRGKIKITFGPGRIRVEDNGRGIPEEALASLTERGITSRPDQGGRGIGLYVAHETMREFGGALRISNRAGPESGAVFELRFQTPAFRLSRASVPLFENVVREVTRDPFLRTELRKAQSVWRSGLSRVQSWGRANPWAFPVLVLVGARVADLWLHTESFGPAATFLAMGGIIPGAPRNELGVEAEQSVARSPLPESVSVRLLEHPEEEYAFEASQNVGLVLRALGIPEKTVVVNVGSGRNPLRAHGYRIINVDEALGMDVFAQDGQEVHSAGFFEDSFSDELRRQGNLETRPHVMVFLNMWTFMGIYGPVKYGKADERSFINAHIYLERAWEVLPPGGRVILLQHMPPEMMGAPDTQVSVAAARAFEQIARKNKDIHVTRIYRTTNDGEDMVGVALERRAAPARNTEVSTAKGGGAMIFSALGLLGWLTASVGMSVTFGHDLMNGSVLGGLSLLGAFSGLGVAVNYGPRLFYAVNLLRLRRTPSLTPETLTAHVTPLLEELEARGDLPVGYRRPTLQVLPRQAWGPVLLSGLQLGYGENGVVSLHRHFDALPADAQRAILRHEVFEAFGEGHWRATWEEYRTLLGRPTQNMPADYADLARRVRAVPTEDWLGAELVKALQQLHPTAGDVRTWPRLELDDPTQIAPTAFFAIQKGLPENQLVVARMLKYVPEEKALRVLVFVDTLRHLWKLIPTEMSYATEFMESQATAGVWFYPETQEFSFAALVVSPEVRGRGTGLGLRFMQQIGQVLNRIWPGAPISARAVHPVSAYGNEKWFGMTIDWLNPAESPWVKENAFRALGVIAPGEYVGASMTDLAHALQLAKAKAGNGAQSDLVFLLNRLRTMAQDFRAHPEAFQAWRDAMQRYLFGYYSDQSWQELPDERSLVRRLFEVTLHELYMRGHVGSDTGIQGAGLSGVSDDNAPSITPSEIQAKSDGHKAEAVRAAWQNLKTQAALRTEGVMGLRLDTLERTTGYAVQLATQAPQEKILVFLRATWELVHMAPEALVRSWPTQVRQAFYAWERAVQEILPELNGYARGENDPLRRGNALRASLGRGVLGALGAISVGVGLSLSLSPAAALTTVSLWGMFSGLSLVLVFVPRLWYALQLLRPRAPALHPETVSTQVNGVLEALERQGALPVAYRRPVFQVLPAQSWFSLLGRGLLIGRGEAGRVSLHPNFLSLSPMAQRAVLRHELFEAHASGHLRASWEEWKGWVRELVGQSTRLERLAYQMRARSLAEWIGPELEQALRLQHVGEGFGAEALPVLSAEPGEDVAALVQTWLRQGVEPNRLVVLRRLTRDEVSQQIRLTLVVDALERLGAHVSQEGTLTQAAVLQAPVALELTISPNLGRRGIVYLEGVGINPARRGLGAGFFRQLRVALQSLMPESKLVADVRQPMTASMVAEQFDADLAWWDMPAAWGSDWTRALAALGLPMRTSDPHPALLDLRNQLARLKRDSETDIQFLLRRLEQLRASLSKDPVLLQTWLRLHAADLRGVLSPEDVARLVKDPALFTQRLFELTLFTPRLEGIVSAPETDQPEIQGEPAHGLVEREMERGQSGRPFSAQLVPEEMLPVDNIQAYLESAFAPDVTRALVSMEYHAAGLGPKLYTWLPTILDKARGDDTIQARAARQTLEAVRAYVSEPDQAAIDQTLNRVAYLDYLWLVTTPGRLSDVNQFLFTHPGIRALLQRPGGAVVNDIGLGGPEPVTTGELTQWVQLINPENQVIGADIFIPAFRSTDRQSRVFAYHNAQGEIIGLYNANGNPLILEGADYYSKRFGSALENYRQGNPVTENIDILPNPLEAYAREHGFTVRFASYGDGIRAAVKLCFNVLYMNPGRETSILTRMGKDLEPGGYLLNGNAAPKTGVHKTSFVLYRKGENQRLVPQGVYFLNNGVQYLFPLKPEYQTILTAESLAREEFMQTRDTVILSPKILIRYGLTPEDVVVTPMTSVSKNTIKKERNKLMQGRDPRERLKRELRVAPLRALGATVAALGVGSVLSFALAPAALLTTLSVWGVASGLALAANYAPRLWYLFQVIQPRAPVLTPATVNQQLAALIADLERRGGLPPNYRRPQLEVLPVQTLRSQLLKGVLLGKGRAGVVSLHANFLSLAPAAQRAILLHEIYEAHTGSHALASVRELGALLRSAGEALWRTLQPWGWDVAQALQSWWGMPATLFAWAWAQNQVGDGSAVLAMAPLTVLGMATGHSGINEVNDAELLSGNRGQAAEIAVDRTQTVPIDAIADLLRSNDAQDNVRGMVGLEAHWTEMDEELQYQGLRFLIMENANTDQYIARAAWHALKRISPYLQGANLRQAEETLRRYQTNNQLILMTHEGRLNSAYQFLIQHPLLQYWLQRPEGITVNDVGLGGPDPVTTAELTQFITRLNPRNKVVGADILVPAFRVTEWGTGIFAYLNANGEVIGVYKRDGQPVEQSGYEPMMVDAYRKYKQGRDDAVEYSVVANPLQTYAMSHGFSVVEASYGRGIKAEIKIVFNVLYMNAGRETEIITRMAEDMPTGGILISGFAFVLRNKPYTSFVIYQKQSDGSMRAHSVNKMYGTDVSVFPLKSGHQGIAEAEQANQTLRINYDGTPLLDPDILGKFGLHPDDVEVSTLEVTQPAYSLNDIQARTTPTNAPSLGNLFVSPRRYVAGLLAGVGANLAFALWSSPEASLALVTAWGLGWLVTVLPRLIYVLQLGMSRAPVLQPSTAQAQLASLFKQVEQEGGLPSGYHRPQVEVLPRQNAGTFLTRGVLVGQGGKGVVRLHRNFLSLAPSAQHAILRHEIFEAFGQGHLRATWAEGSAYARRVWQGLGRTWNEVLRALVSFPLRFVEREGLLPVLLFSLYAWLTGQTYLPDEDLLLEETPLEWDQQGGARQAAELQTGIRGEVAIIPVQERRAVPIEGIQFKLFSRSIADVIQGMASIELRAAEMTPDQLEDAARNLMRLNAERTTRTSRMAWQTLNAIKDRLTPEIRARAEANLREFQRNGRLVLTTSPQRLNKVYGFMVQHPGIRALLKRKGGVVINDIGLGGPTPYTTADLTNLMQHLNPENKIIGADILLPAFRTWDGKNGMFAYHNAQGELIGLYSRDGRPIPEKDDADYRARFIQQFRRYQAGDALEEGLEVTRDPIQTYAREKGFEVKLASYGAGIRAGIKLCFNVLYMNPGRETEIISRMGADLEPGGYLLSGIAATAEQTPFAVFSLYHKQSDGQLLPLSVHMVMDGIEYEFPMKPGYQTIERTENLAMEEYKIYSGQLLLENRQLEKYGLTPRDVKVSRAIRNAQGTSTGGWVTTTLGQEQAQALRVSPLRALGTALLGVGLGTVMGNVLSPDAALGTVSLWGVVGGLAWLLNYVPRAYYAFRLLTGRTPKLETATSELVLRGTFTEVEREGGLPAGYVRPQVEVLPAQSWRSQLWNGLLMGEGLRRADGTPVVRLHAKFLSLPFAVRVAVLRHEIFEAHARGHLRATWEEFRSYVLPKRLHEGLPQVQRSSLQNIDTFRENSDKALSEVTYQGERVILSERVAAGRIVRFDPLTPEGIVELVRYYTLLDSLRYAGARIAPQALAVVREGGQIVGYLMEKIPGAPLGDLVEEGVLNRAQIEEALGQIREQLTLLHRYGYGHGDLHARNIMVDLSGGRVRARLFDYKPGWGVSIETYDQELWDQMNSEIWVGYQNRRDPHSEARLLAQSDAIDAALAGEELSEGFLAPYAPGTERIQTPASEPRTFSPSLILTYQTEPGVLPRDVARIREAQNQGGLLNEAVLAVLGTERNRLVQIGPDVKLHLLGRGAFKSAYRAEILVRFENGETRWLTVAVKVPRNLLGRIVSFERNNWERLQGHPNVVAFVRDWHGVLAEAFVDAVPEQPSQAQSRRVAATYLSLLAHLWNRQGEHWFFYDPKVENIMFPKNPSEAPKVVDLDGVALTPVKFSPFTVLTYLTAYHGASALWLTRVLSGLAAPIMLFTSAVFAYVVKPQRVVFDAFLDAFGVENGRRYLEAAQHGWVHAFAARSALAKALDAYLRTEIGTYQAPVSRGSLPGLSSAVRPTLESLTAQLKALRLPAWIGPETERVLRTENRESRAVNQWPVLDVTPYQSIPQVMEHARAQGMQSRQLVAVRAVYPDFKRQSVRVMLLVDRLEQFERGTAQREGAGGSVWRLDESSLKDRAQFVFSVELRPNLGPAGEVVLEACTLGVGSQKQGESREMRLRLREGLSSVLPGAVMRGHAMHPASVSTLLQAFEADLDWEHPGMEAELDPLVRALTAMEVLPRGTRVASLADLRTALQRARQRDGMAAFNDALYMMHKLQTWSARFQEARADFPAWVRAYALPNAERPRIWQANPPDRAAWNVFLFQRLFGGFFLVGRVPVPGEDSVGGWLGPTVEGLHPVVSAPTAAPLSPRLEQTAQALRNAPLSSWVRADLARALMAKNHETKTVDEWPVLDVRLDQDLSQVFAEARARGLQPQQVMALRVVETLPQQGAVRTALLVDTQEGFMARWKGLPGEALESADRARAWTLESASLLERAQVTLVVSLAPEKNQTGEVYVDVFALDADLQQRGLGAALTESLQTELSQIVPGARVTALTVHPAAAHLLARTFTADIAWNEREAQETLLRLGSLLTALDLVAPNAFRRTSVADIRRAFENAKQQAGAQTAKDIDFILARLTRLARTLAAHPDQYALWALQHGVRSLPLPEGLRRPGAEEREWAAFLFRTLVQEVYVQGRVPQPAVPTETVPAGALPLEHADAAFNQARTRRLRNMEASLKARSLEEWLGADLIQALRQRYPSRPAGEWPVLEVTPRQDMASALENARRSGVAGDGLVVIKAVQASRRSPLLQIILLVDTLEHFEALGERARQARPKKLFEEEVGNGWWLDGLQLLNQAAVVLKLDLNLSKDMTGDVYLDALSLWPQLQGRGLGRGMLEKVRGMLTEHMPGARVEAFAVHPVMANTVVRDYAAELDWNDPLPAKSEHARLENVWARLGLEGVPGTEGNLEALRQQVLLAKQQAGQGALRDAEYLLARFEAWVAQVQGHPEVLRGWALKHGVDMSTLTPEQRQGKGDVKALTQALYDVAILTLHLRGRVPEASGENASAPVTPVRPTEDTPSTAAQVMLAERNGRLELRSADPAWLQAWEFFQTTAAAPVLEALAAHVRSGGSVAFTRTPGNTLFLRQGQAWTLDGRLLVGGILPGQGHLGPAPLPVWELLVGSSPWALGGRAWGMSAGLDALATRYGSTALARSTDWVRRAAMPTGGELWRTRLGFTGAWDALTGRAGSVHASELGEWLRVNLLRPLPASDVTPGVETTLPKALVESVRQHVQMQVRAQWGAYQAVALWRQLPQTAREQGLTMFADQAELLPALKQAVQALSERGDEQARTLLPKLTLTQISETPGAVAPAVYGLVFLTRVQSATPSAQSAAWSRLITQGRMYVFGRASNAATNAFAAEQVLNWKAWQTALVGVGPTVVGQESEWLQAGLGEVARVEDQLGADVETAVVRQSAFQQILQDSVLGTRSRTEQEALLQDTAAQLFDEVSYDASQQVLVVGVQTVLPVARRQATESTPWQTASQAQSAPELSAWTGTGTRLTVEPASRLTARISGLRNRFFLAMVAGIFLTRKVTLLQTAFGRSSEVRGNRLWAIVRHSQFAIVVRTVWGVITGTLMVRGEVDAATAEATARSLNRNPLFNGLFGRSPWVNALRVETAALQQASERLGTIGMELAPEAYLKYQLDRQLQATGVGERERGLLVRNLWENPSWTRNLVRLQALSRDADRFSAARQQLRLLRLERRLLASLLSELQQPGTDAAYQLAVVKALAVFTPDQQVRVRMAVPEGRGVTYAPFWIPELVLRQPQLRNQLVTLFPVYDDAGLEVKPADPSVIRSLAGSA